MNNTCAFCVLDGCRICSDLTSCSQCVEGKGYFLDDSQCKTCSLKGCLRCDSLQECGTCQEGYWLDGKTCKEEEFPVVIVAVCSGVGVIIIVVVVVTICLCRDKQKKEDVYKENEPEMTVQEKSMAQLMAKIQETNERME